MKAQLSRTSRSATLLGVLALCACVQAAATQAGEMGPLTVDARNRRYFVDARGQAVFLIGAHTWNDLVDMGVAYPPPRFDFGAFLDFLQVHRLNATRLWAWEVPRPEDGGRYPRRVVAAPQPWLRTGPGNDVTGLPKFDLSRLDPEYFERLVARVKAARERGIYVVVMLFEGWSAQFSKGRLSHPFLAANNVNGIGDISDPRDIYTLRHPAITAIQKRYAAAVVDALAGMDNVLFEICNEAGGFSTAWQYEMIAFVKSLQAASGVRHPVGMSYQHAGGRNAELFASDADWVAPGWDTGHYLTVPELATGRRVVIADTDHLGGSGFSDRAWLWRSLFRGLNVLYMDHYSGRDSVSYRGGGVELAEFRYTMGLVRLFAERIDIGSFTPSETLSSTGFALRAEDRLLVYAPQAGTITLDLAKYPGTLAAEWFDTQTGELAPASALRGGDTVALDPAFTGGAVLYLRPPGAQARSLADVAPQARRMYERALAYASWSSRARAFVRRHAQRLGLDRAPLLLACAMLFAAGLGAGWLMGRRAARRP